MTHEHETGNLDVADRLERLAELAVQVSAAAVAQDARALVERVREGRFFVACLGQFKRGKSTLINALLGEDVLPSGVAPVTSVVTVVRFGERRARVRVGLDEWHDVAVETLGEYVAESQNPENRKGVTGVEVFCRSAFLERGLCLVDTPGIGSVFAGNTEETRSFVPHVDAAVVVLGGDPPISGDELELVKDVAKRVQNVLFVLNKADRLNENERREAVAFTRTVLRDQLAIEEPVLFEVSALERLRGTAQERDWPRLLAKLETLGREGGTELVARAATRGLEGLVDRLHRYLSEERAALQRPVEESEERLRTLRKCARDAEQAAVELRYLFDAEQKKLGQLFDDHRTRFVAETIPEVVRRLDERLPAAPVSRGPGLRRYALDQAQDVTEPLVRAWMDQQRPIAEREFAAVTERFVGHANAFLDRLATAGQLPSDALPAKLVAETGMRARSRYYFASFMTLTTPPLWLWIADWFRTERSARTSARVAGLGFAKRLLEVNANRVVGDFDECITESRRSVEGALGRTLREIVTTAEGAAQRASEVRKQGTAAVETELAALDRRLANLGALQPPGGS